MHHSSEETSQRWRAISGTVSDLVDPGIEPQTLEKSFAFILPKSNFNIFRFRRAASPLPPMNSNYRAAVDPLMVEDQTYDDTGKMV